MTYADVILPLALSPGTLTYEVPETLAALVEKGSRVIVPVGKRKFYTAIVTRLHHVKPTDNYMLKPIAEVQDSHPIVRTEQLDLWAWMAQYYMCTPGEVMKAALPAGLKAESESVVALSPTFDPDSPSPLSTREQEVVNLLLHTNGLSIESVSKQLDVKNALPTVQRLLDKGVVRISENMKRAFRPRTELHVRLTTRMQSETALHLTLDALERAPKQQRLLLRYLDLSKASAALTLHQPALLIEVSKAQLLEQLEGADAALTALRSKDILETYCYETSRLPSAASPLPECMSPLLSPAQQQALDQISQSFCQKPICLLHGVTSSGKTEIYTHLIRRELDAGRQVLYLLPEIALTTQIMQRMARAFGKELGVYHSKFPDAERVELWQKQLSDHPFHLILGTRSALLLPFQNLGLVIVDEEHDASYKQQDPAPRYNARDTATVLARMYGAHVLMGTATPSLETYHNALTGKFGLVELTERFGNIMLPQIHVEDVKELRRKKLMTTPFSPLLIDEMRAALTRGEQVILFQNRRGYSPLVECHTCGWVPRCTCCDVSLTYHQSQHQLVCHYCGATYPVPPRCPNCGDTDLRDLGYGTEKIEAAVHALFPKARTARLDLDTTRARTAYEQIIGNFSQGNTDILIGTQMVTKGLDFDRVHVVGILNADQSLSQPHFRAFERAFQMLSQVAGRAGRRNSRGTVVLQTKQPDQEVITRLVHTDFLGLYHSQMEERHAYHYPPYYRLITIYLKHRDEHKVETAAHILADWLRSHYGENLLGPDKPLVGRVQLMYIRQMMLKVDVHTPASPIRQMLHACRNALLKSADYKSVTIYFDVDPA